MVRLLRFVQGWSKFGETYARCTTELLNTTLILLLLVTTYSVVAYLVFHLFQLLIRSFKLFFSRSSESDLPIQFQFLVLLHPVLFQSFPHSDILITSKSAFKLIQYFQLSFSSRTSSSFLSSSPSTSSVLLYSLMTSHSYRLFAAVVMEALRNTNDHVPMMRKLTSTIDAKIPSYFVRRLKLRFGIIKVKQVTWIRLRFK